MMPQPNRLSGPTPRHRLSIHWSRGQWKRFNGTLERGLLSAAKRTLPSKRVMSAPDPKRTLTGLQSRSAAVSYVLSFGSSTGGVGSAPTRLGRCATDKLCSPYTLTDQDDV